MPETVKIPIPCYSMKMQIYPSDAQKEKIDRIFRALHVAYNITFHEVFQKNPAVCTTPKENGEVWPDFRKMAKKEWQEFLKQQNPIVEEAPAAALTTNQGLFLSDAKKAWETGMHKRPVSPALRQEFRFYNAGKPRRSFVIQLDAAKLEPSNENPKVAWLRLPKVEGRIKARGFNRKLCFGEDGHHDFSEALAAGELANALTVRVSKDPCGSYFVSVTFSDGKKHDRKLYLETPSRTVQEPVGIDVGIKDVAILSNGQKIANRHFKKERDIVLRRMNRQLSRRWGPANMAFRDYNREIRKENRKGETETPQPLAVPSKRYLALQQNKSKLERKIARRRETYYHQATAAIIRQSSFVAVETLHVKNMLRNHKLAYALTDAAMSDFLSKLKYKAERFGVPLVPIGAFEPSSQLCSTCGEQYPAAKSLGIRFWTCPQCGTRHDRDINAAKNILSIALTRGPGKDEEMKSPQSPAPKAPGRPRQQSIFLDYPQLTIVFSKQLSKMNDPRYVIKDRDTNRIVDDAQGAGYRSISNAKNCFKAKKKWSA